MPSVIQVGFVRMIMKLQSPAVNFYGSTFAYSPLNRHRRLAYVGVTGRASSLDPTRLASTKELSHINGELRAAQNTTRDARGSIAAGFNRVLDFRIRPSSSCGNLPSHLKFWYITLWGIQRRSFKRKYVPKLPPF